ncbi:FAD:protein FMN transferase [Lachnospiraceae bacterium 62-35]
MLLLFVGGCKGRKMEPVSRSNFLLNTVVTVTLYDSEDTELLDGCMKLCEDYEKMFSKTIETSDIYRLNHREPGTRKMEVSPETAELIQKGLSYSRLSDGAFDITIEPLTALWDFTAEEPQLPDKEAIKKACKQVDYKKIRVEDNYVFFLSDDAAIDLGAIAKGYIADRMKEYLEEKQVKSAIINLGGNVLCLGKRPDGEPFKVGIQKPFQEHNVAAEVMTVEDSSMVVSGVYERHFVIDGVNYHHILNPETGLPYQNGLDAVAIFSKQSVDGDGLSTSCFSMGLERGMELIDSLEGVYGVFLTDDGKLHYSRGAEELRWRD